MIRRGPTHDHWMGYVIGYGYDLDTREELPINIIKSANQTS